MTCGACGVGRIVWGHDAEEAAHSFDPGQEERCVCSPTAICIVCDIELIVREGFVLVPKREPRCLAPASAVRH